MRPKVDDRTGAGAELPWQSRLNEPLGAGQSGVVTYQAQVPGGYLSSGGAPFIKNCADARLGTGAPFVEDCAYTMVSGPNALGDTVWRDDGAGGGIRNNGLQDGAEAGIANITVWLYWDMNGNGVLDSGEPLVGTTTTNGATTANYSFANLPDANYIVKVDTLDGDLPIGYAATSPKQYAIALDPNHGSAAGVTVNTADFGFGPPLTLDKHLTANNPAYEGDMVTYQIDLRNNLPGDGTINGSCTYTIWSTIAHQDSTNSPPGGNGGTAQWQNVANVLNAPDTLYSTTIMNDNSDLLGLSGFNSGNQGGTIMSVRYIAYVRETANLKATDSFKLRVWYTPGGTGVGAALATYSYFGDGTGEANYFAGPAGSIYQVTRDITALRAWSWADFANNVTEIQLEGNKGGGAGTSGDIAVDAAGYVITTNQLCGSADSTITTLPLTDTYDPARLQFVSASIAPTSITPAGTLTWANVGPLNAGQTKTITVVFKALDPGANTIVTVNTASVSGAKYGDGRDTNTPPNATANVTIIATGSIAGVVWSEGSGGTAGWAGTTGYENLGTTDFGIPGVTVTLYGCVDSSGVLITSVNTTKTCSGQSGGAGWMALATQTTAANGSYYFGGLRMGYYYVGVTGGLPAGATQSAEPVYNGAGLTCGTANATCSGNWNPTGAATTVANTNLSPVDFNPIGGGNPLSGPNEDIVNVNFGYNNVPARIFGKVYLDANGNGRQGSGEADLSGITVRLCSDPSCTTVLTTTTTNATGQYSFSGFSTPGSYYVVVTPPAGMVQTADRDQPGVTCSNCDNRTNVIAISAGQTRGAYDFGYQPSGPYTIGDTLYVDWNGSSTQDSGEEGVANVTVWLYEDENGNGVVDAADALIATTVTNANGSYFFNNRPNGTYLVVVDQSDADFPATYTPTQDLDGGADAKAKVTVAGANRLDVDFGYRPVGFSAIGDYVWWDMNGDGLQTTGEMGIDGVLVRLFQDDNGNGIVDAGDAVVATQLTSGAGGYNFTGLAAGNYIVEIAPSNFGGGQPLASFTMTTVGPAYTNNAGQVSYQKSLAAGEVYLNADFGFAQGLIGDFIWRDDNGNGTPDTGEPGIAGVTVTLYNDVNGDGVYDAGDTFRAATATNGDGYYEFGGLPAGDYVVVVTAPAGHTLSGDPDAYSIDPGNYPYLPCDPADAVHYVACDNQYGTSLYAGQVDRSADFGYRPQGVIGDTVWIDGNNDGVRDTGEAGIPFVAVRLCSALPCSGGNIVATTTTNSDGNYSFGGLNTGTYHVYVDAADPNFPAGLAPTFDPDGVLDNTGSSIVMSGGVVTAIGGMPCSNCNLNVDFGYRFSGSNSVTGTIWHDDDSGGQSGGIGDIDDPSGVFYGGVTVYLWNCGAGTCADGDETLAGVTTSDSSGQYGFTNLANGNYAVAINNNDSSLAGTDATTTTLYANAAGEPWVVLGGGSSAIRDFGRIANIDMGDLPLAFRNTVLGDDGARHRLVDSGQVYLGAVVDADPNGQESANATGDDGDVDGDDDDGVVRSAGNWSNGSSGGGVTVTVFCPAGGCYLSAWIDWNHDNDFNDGGEQILLDFAVVDGVQVITFDVPAGTFPAGSATFNARFRLYSGSTAGLAQPTGYVVNGEVEDYQWTFAAPTAIGLDYFQTGGMAATPLQLALIAFVGLALAGLVVSRRRRGY